MLASEEATPDQWQAARILWRKMGFVSTPLDDGTVVPVNPDVPKLSGANAATPRRRPLRKAAPPPLAVPPAPYGANATRGLQGGRGDRTGEAEDEDVSAGEWEPAGAGRDDERAVLTTSDRGAGRNEDADGDSHSVRFQPEDCPNPDCDQHGEGGRSRKPVSNMQSCGMRESARTFLAVRIKELEEEIVGLRALLGAADRPESGGRRSPLPTARTDATLVTKKAAAAAFEKWKAELDAKAVEWARAWAERDARMEAEMDARCPASEGWFRLGCGARVRPRDGPPVPMAGEGI